jgi:hypothetical protein
MKPIHGFALVILFGALTSAAASSAGTPPVPGNSGFAVVDSDGNLVRGTNVIGAQKLDTGIYDVEMNSPVKKCVFTATTGLPGSTSVNDPAYITVAGRGGEDDGVFVKTYDINGNSADFGFHLNVRC